MFNFIIKFPKIVPNTNSFYKKKSLEKPCFALDTIKINGLGNTNGVIFTAKSSKELL